MHICILVVHSLSESGQKKIEYTQDVALKLLENYGERSTNSSQRMTKLLLFLGQVKALSKDIEMLIKDKEIVGSEDALLKLISQSL